jgi:hypothetical protein
MALVAACDSLPCLAGRMPLLGGLDVDVRVQNQSCHFADLPSSAKLKKFSARSPSF